MRPMYEEREWGDYTVLNVNMDEEHRKAVTKKKTVRCGGQIPEKIHKEHCTVWTVLSGKAVIRINGRNHDAYAVNTHPMCTGEAGTRR